MRIASLILLGAILSALLGCAGVTSGPRLDEALRNQVQAQMDARAELEASLRYHALQLQQYRLRHWEAIQDRAQRELEARAERLAARREAQHRFWSSRQWYPSAEPPIAIGPPGPR